jgi:hypothetical protein
MTAPKFLLVIAALFSHVSAWGPSSRTFSRYSTKLRYTGTGSARCGVFDLKGKMLASASKAIATYQPEGMPELYEQVHPPLFFFSISTTYNILVVSGVMYYASQDFLSKYFFLCFLARHSSILLLKCCLFVFSSILLSTVF